MKKYYTSVYGLLFFVFAGLIAFQLESCSSQKSMVSCPDLRSKHHTMAMLHPLHHSIHMSSLANRNVKNLPAPTADNSPKASVNEPIAPIAIASTANEIPSLKNAQDMFRGLSNEQRTEAKTEISKIFSKNKLIGGLVMKKMERLDKKYPAPAESAQSSGGHLTTGEILSIVAIACAVTWVLGIAALIIGIIALIKIRREGGRSWARALAIVAIVLGVLEIVSFGIYIGIGIL